MFYAIYRCRKGIPDAVRGAAWYSISGGKRLHSRNISVYSDIVNDDSRDHQEHEIMRDIGRTYPEHEFFSGAWKGNILEIIYFEYSVS